MNYSKVICFCLAAAVLDASETRAQLVSDSATTSVASEKVSSSSWPLIKPPKHDFEFRMPEASDPKTVTAPHPLGNIHIEIYTATEEECSYTVAINTYPLGFIEKSAKDREAFLKMAAAGGRASKAGAKVLKIKIEKADGNEHTLVHTFEFPEGVNSSGLAFPACQTFHRAILRGNKLVLFQVDISQSDLKINPEKCKAKVTAFFDKYKLSADKK